jgi:3-keto-disaccharide hydrolase
MRRMRTQAATAAVVLAVTLAARGADVPAPGGWRPLFDGKSLAGWRESDFFGAGKITVQDGVITIGSGALTGISWAAASLPFPAAGYEVRVEAARIKGGDFFAGITFPVRDSYCTWIAGGWGGRVVGLSSIDGADASMNETTSDRIFELGRWYTLRLRVTPDAITAWIDDELVIDFRIGRHWIALREGEIEHSVPFGIATYNTVGAVRKIEWRPVAAASAPDSRPKR